MNFANEFRIQGNLVADVRRGHTSAGVTTAFYVVAAEQKLGDRCKSSIDFIPITTYGMQAENDLRYLSKGRAVAVRGRIRSWYDSGCRRGGFRFEPEPGCVRYIGAPVARPVKGAMDSEIAGWVDDYEAHMHEFDAGPSIIRPGRSAAGA